tara:strand:+ start:11670 stop:13088 length:1419 start_codon:yes stop_codon:yes gene_type:complete
MMHRVLALSVALILSATAAAAATIERRDDLRGHIDALRLMYQPVAAFEGVDQAGAPPGYGVFRLSGVIETGDAEKLAQMQQALWDEGKFYAWVLVLDSPGGNFLEGIKLGKALKENLSSQDPALIATYVLDGDTCLSACAMAFALAATLRDFEGSDASRFIETGARLGFHMGALPEHVATQTAQVREVMNLTYDIMASYTEILRDKTNPVILVQEALNHREADSFFEVRAGQRALDLGFLPVTSGPLANPVYAYALPMSAVEAMCRSLLHASTVQTTIVTDEYDFLSASDAREVTLSEFADARGWAGYSASFTSGEGCQIGVTADQRLLLNVTRAPVPCADGSHPGDRWCALAEPPETLATVAVLADALGCPGGVFHRSFTAWSQDRTGIAWAFDETWQRTTRAAVNMRAEPGLDTAIVGELGAGQGITVSDCRVTQDSQALWFQVQDGAQPGWISARFIADGNMGGFRAPD